MKENRVFTFFCFYACKNKIIATVCVKTAAKMQRVINYYFIT